MLYRLKHTPCRSKGMPGICADKQQDVLADYRHRGLLGIPLVFGFAIVCAQRIKTLVTHGGNQIGIAARIAAKYREFARMLRYA